MRENKYRAWKHTDTPEMFNDVQGIDFKNRVAYLGYRLSSSTVRTDVEQLDNLILMQYTGLTDKNGVEIYEGDILKRTVTIHIFGSDIPEDDVDEYLKVEYRNEYAGFFIGETPLHHYVGARYDVHTKCRCTDVEVIGNISENPELLE